MKAPKKSESKPEEPVPEVEEADNIEARSADGKSAAKPSALSGSRGWLLLLAVVVGAGLLVFASGRHLKDVGKVGEAIVKATKKTGKAAIGGPFELIDHNGTSVTDKTYVGKYMLVNFGYTYCPDVCPTNLTKMSNALDILGADVDKIVPIFISVDPVRDTPEQLKEYGTFFHPRLVGLTGTKDQVTAVARAYRVYFAKVENKEPNADPDDYTVDHSALTYLMGQDGIFQQHFGHGTSAEQMAKRIKEIVNP